ncbi:hypothetical protein IDJ77_08300 [Mucilaginibacter sp. ZT4R22]|uniref:Uncharacterized protein n=1 Tax=Mucilaginibacter pankratovii TaxID=2772110 RepID=A0ABR7WNC1_9SPHI|nr:hypothetical protein [Mucilaginibacter pankratovii]MBD1363810.1 hypothetical protein [Mucilaginibacter pankratovii]
MNIKSKIKENFNIELDALELKINHYLASHFYRILEKGSDYIIFVDDEFSDRKRTRSDFHSRIGRGMFKFGQLTDRESYLELTYFTSLSHFIIMFFLFSAFCVYTNNFIMPIFISIGLTLPILIRIFHLNKHVFEEVMH